MPYALYVRSVELPNKGHLRTAEFVLCKVVVLLGRFTMCYNYREDLYMLGLQILSFVERFEVLCPYLGESTIGVSSVYRKAMDFYM